MQLHPHLYADDTQICGFCASAEASDLEQHISTCVDRVSEWMQAYRLQLNAAKTELLWCAPHRQQDRLPNAALRVSSNSVQLVRCVRNFGIYRQRCFHAYPHHENRVELLFCSPTAFGGPSVSRWTCCYQWLRD